MLEGKQGMYGPFMNPEGAARDVLPVKTIPQAYSSLYDRASVMDIKSSTAYRGSIRRIVTELGNSLGSNTPDAVLKQIHHPVRLIREVLNRKEGLPPEEDSNDAVEVVRAAAKLGLDTYRQSTEAPKSLVTFTETANRVLGDDFPDVNMWHKLDHVTWEATSAEYSRNTAKRLSNMNMGDILFIALAHGGISAGMDVFLRYCKDSGSVNSDFYPVRFSTRKMQDMVPSLTQKELEHLRGLAEERPVVIFDEDVSSGNTLHRAELFFMANMPGSRIVTETNMDVRNSASLNDFKYGKFSEFYMPTNHIKPFEHDINKIPQLPEIFPLKELSIKENMGNLWTDIIENYKSKKLEINTMPSIADLYNKSQYIPLPSDHESHL